MRPLLAAGVLLVCAAPTAARSDLCNKHGRTTLELNRVSRIYDQGGTVYTCWRASGRATRLFSSDDLYESGRVDDVAQRYVAYDKSAIPACKADCPPGVTTSHEAAVVDTKTGRRKVLTSEDTSVVVVTSDGAAAWLVGDGPGATLHARAAQGARVLGSGEIAAGSVKLSGRTLRWVQDGAPRSAMLA